MTGRGQRRLYLVHAGGIEPRGAEPAVDLGNAERPQPRCCLPAGRLATRRGCHAVDFDALRRKARRSMAGGMALEEPDALTQSLEQR